MGGNLLILAGITAIATALVHSILGEKRLIGPIILSDAAIMRSPLAKQVLRLAWHWTSALWVLVAGVLIHAGMGNFVDRPLLMVIGIAHLFAGLADAILTRGKHVGWPLITLIGVLTLLALYI